MDLPWRKVWPILLVFFTFPVGFPFYTVSQIRLQKHRKKLARNTPVVQPQRRPPEPEVGVINEEAAEEELIDDQPHLPQILFYSAPNAARIIYRELRATRWRKHLHRELDAARAQKQDVDYRLRDYGERLREIQSERNELTAKVRRLESLEDENALVPDLVHLDAEFERLIKLPGVEGVRVVNGEISVLVKPRITYEGTKYDLGDWELRFGGDDTLLRTIELRSGVQCGWDGNYPVYRLGGGAFCFGERGYTIDDNLAKGQFLEAIELAIDCMQSVNPDHEGRIPRAFKEAV